MNKLYKRKASGQVRVWSVKASNGTVRVRYGIEGGKITEKVTHCKPKNEGRSNETTVEQQAVLEAKALYTKKMDRECYVTDLSHSAPYIQPMLALDANKVGHRIAWDHNQYAQPKLDGVRGFHVAENVNSVQSRKGTLYNLPILYQQLEELRIRLDLPKDDMFIDGEVFKMGVPLGKINGAAKKYCELTDELEFHIFDLASNSGLVYEERKKVLESVSEENLKEWGLTKLAIVKSYSLTEGVVQWYHDQFVINGYEGLMIRDGQSAYGFDERSDGLLKYKKFLEDEFEVIDINPDKDGQAIITYKAPPRHHPDKPTFDSRPRGPNTYREYLVANKKKYIGNLGTVRYFALTEYGIPQFPVTILLDPDK